jgi:DNA-binding LytR/AlgR family response regulator
MATLKVQAGHLIVQRRNEQTRWRFEDILWLEARGHRTKLHARDGAHLIAAGLAAFVHWLPRDRFQRLNRSLLVNREHHLKEGVRSQSAKSTG